MLLGPTPPDGVRLRNSSPVRVTAKTVTSLLPELAAKSQLESSVRTTAPCGPRSRPFPSPPVGALPALTSEPSVFRWKIRIELPALALVAVYTAPRLPCANALAPNEESARISPAARERRFRKGNDN